jgi:hypothetical protein
MRLRTIEKRPIASLPMEYHDEGGMLDVCLLDFLSQYPGTRCMLTPEEHSKA